MSLADSNSMAELGELLADRVAGRGVAGLAVRPAPHAPAEVLWTPAGDPREPGFPAYSITKTFTAAIALQLVDEGRLALDHTLDRWFPEIDRAERITIRQLLQHRAGIPDYGAIAAYHEALRATPGTPWDFDQYARETWERGLLFEPGEAFAYSNPGYLLLAHIASELLGETYREMIERRIAKPLGLERTFVVEEIAGWESLAPGLSRQLDLGSEPVDVRSVYHPGWVSHGVVASTPSELLAFYEALFEERIVSAGAVAQMVQLQPIGRQASGYGDPSYGLGLMGDPRTPHGRMWGHNGGGPGYTTSAFFGPDFPGGGALVCVMCAVEEDEFAFGILRAVLDLLRSE